MSYKDVRYYRRYPEEWIYFLKDELAKEFPDFASEKLLPSYLPPVATSSLVGKLAAKLPSKPS